MESQTFQIVGNNVRQASTPAKKSTLDMPYEGKQSLAGIQNPKNQKLVEVVFYDPAEFDTNYSKDLNPIECITIGWLEEQNSAMIRISWLREEKDEPYVGLAIPRGCIKSIQELKN